MDSGVEINGFPSITWENNKPREKGYMASITKEYDGGETTNIRVYVATGQWNTAAEHDGRSTAAKDGFIFSKAYEADGGVNIVVSGKSQKDQEQQIVAIDTNGISHPISNDSMGCNDVRQMSGRFNNIKPSQIKEFRVQTRPYQWIEFRNVSLRPGVKTDVQVLQQAPQPIGFKITSREFQNGDSIEITGLSGPAGVLRPGQTYIVSGKYTLKSHDDAALHVYATNGETSSSQGPIMKRGEGQFTRSFTLLKEGDLHLSFYPAEGGDSFGGVYFTQRGADTGTETGAEVVDVAVENFDIRPYPEGGLYTLTVSIRNRGREESPKLGVNFYRGDPNNLKPMMHEAGPIKPGDVWREGSMPFALREGTNVISVVIDPANQIPESNEMNNRAWITVVVKDGKIVKKKVSLSSVHTAEFPEKEDLSTPETAYASINRVSASGDQAGWQRVSVKEIAEKLAMENKNGKMKVEPEWAKVLLNAKIIEVRICDSNIAVVFAELPQEFTSEPIRKPIDVRYLKLEDGKWLNTGNDRVWTIEEARAMFDKVCGKSVATNE
jgi:ketosteroid isomerase-like protein